MKQTLKLLNFKEVNPKFIEATVDHFKNQEIRLTFKLRQKDVDPNLFFSQEFKTLEKGKDLWKKTCFECFFFDESSDQYFEINISLDGKYDLMSFTEYRKESFLEAPLKVSNLSIKVDQEDAFVSFELKTFFKNPYFISPSVILDTQKEQLFFAINHSPLKPDFHKKPKHFLK